MSMLSEWARNNPELAAFLRTLAIAALEGSTPRQRQHLLDQAALLDSDGDGIPDEIDPEPNTPDMPPASNTAPVGKMEE